MTFKIERVVPLKTERVRKKQLLAIMDLLDFKYSIKDLGNGCL